VIVIPVVHGKLLQVRLGKFARATRAHPRIQLERPRPVVRLTRRGIATGLRYNCIKTFVVHLFSSKHGFTALSAWQTY